MTTLLIGAFIVIVLVAISGAAASNKGSTRANAIYRYDRKNFFMNRAEHEFFDILVAIVGNSYYVFPQVHLSAILEHKIKGQNWRAAFSRINGKSVDFVICDKAYIKPLVAIELDGKSHDQESVRQRDKDIERIFEGADMKLIRFANHGYPDKEEVQQRLSEVLSGL